MKKCKLFPAFRYDGDGEKKIEFCSFGTNNPLCVEMILEDFIFQNPKHICVTSAVTARQRRSTIYYMGKKAADSKLNPSFKRRVLIVSIQNLEKDITDITSTVDAQALWGSPESGHVSFVLGQNQQDMGGKAGFEAEEGKQNRV